MDIESELESISNFEAILKEAQDRKRIIDDCIRAANASIEEVEASIKAYMKENGIQQDQADFGVAKILVTLCAGRESVDCPDIEAVPEKFIRIKKELDKKAIAEFIKGKELPNWAIMKRGEDYIQRRSVIK